MKFNTWLDTFLSEKQVDLDQVLEVEGPSGTNFIPVQCVVDVFKQVDNHNKKRLKDTLVQIDFKNGDVVDFMKHMAQTMVV